MSTMNRTLEKKMKNLKSAPSICLAIGFFLFTGAAAMASPLSLILTSPFQSGEQGVFAFNATVTNTSDETVYLNGDDFNVDSPLSVDDSPFNIDYPQSLAPAAFYTGVLFNVDAPEETPLGLYTGSFEILGGGDPSDDTDVAGSATFDVSVTPEPSSFLLFAAGMLALALAGRRRPSGRFSS